MLVTFSCDAHENITMFGDVARRLLVMMGHSGTLPSAILSEDVPEALSRLRQGITEEKMQAAPAPSAVDEDDNDQVSLAHRAIPLIALLEDAVKAQCNVMWKAS